MKRKDFLKTLGLTTGVASMPPLSNALVKAKHLESMPNACTLIPTETAGPLVYSKIIK